MAEYEAIIGTDDNLNVDVSADIDVPVTVTDNGFVSMSVEPDASVLSIDAEVEPDEIIDVPVQEGLGGISSDHRLLLHRDASNQHPMSAIAGLEDALDNLESALETRIIGAEDDITELSLVEEADRITMANAVIRIDRDITLLQSQVDGNITTWFYDYVPTLGNEPASSWIQAGEEAVHLGDLFYNTDTGYAYRWMSDSANPPTYSWTRITDSDVTKALADAAKAQDTADHKRRVFITTPTPPYDAGDLWFVGVSGDILTCTHSRLESEYYDAGDWSKLHKYTDDTRANEAYDLANNAKLSADGKNRIYRQNSQPTGGVYGAGDVWFDTAHDNKIYRYDGSSWVAVTLGDDAIGNLNASHITAGEIDASQITVSNLDAGNITTGYLDADRLDVDSIIASNSILVSGDSISSLTNDSGYQNSTQVDNAITSKGYQTASDVSSAIGTATADMATNTGVASTYAAKTAAVSEEQLIYKQAVSGTNTMSGTTTWVTATSESVTTGTPPNSAAGLTPIWTTKRPSYQKNYPVLFVAKQKKTVSGTVTCTTPIKDDTTTIIDGGHITTGTIDASQVNVTNIDANSIYIGADVLTDVIEQVTDDLGNTYQLYILTSYTSTSVVHTAQLLQNGVDISADYANDFEWNAKLTSGYEFIGNGRSITIQQSSLHYAHAVTVSWTRRQYAYLLNNSGNNLVTSTGNKLVGRTEY